MIGRILARALHGWWKGFVRNHVLMLGFLAPALVGVVWIRHDVTLGVAGVVPYAVEVASAVEFANLLDDDAFRRLAVGLVALVGSWLAAARIIVRLCDGWGLTPEPWGGGQSGRVTLCAVVATTLLAALAAPPFLLAGSGVDLAESLQWLVLGGTLLALLVVPSLFWLVLPVLGVEEVGVPRALLRNWRLMRGARVVMFGLVLLLVVLNALMLSVTEFVSLERLVYYALTVLLATLKACVLAASYYELRCAREGLPVSTLNQVFD